MDHYSILDSNSQAGLEAAPPSLVPANLVAGDLVSSDLVASHIEKEKVLVAQSLESLVISFTRTLNSKKEEIFSSLDDQMNKAKAISYFLRRLTHVTDQFAEGLRRVSAI